MTVAHPWVLVLFPLALVPLFRLVRRAARVRVPDAQRLGTRTLRTRLLWVAPALQAAIIALLILAAAGPQAGSRVTCDLRNARDIMIALDTSESMNAVDLDPGQMARSRLDYTVALAGDFIRHRRGDRIGLIAFGGRAVTQCPVTFDRELALWLLEQVQPNMLGRRTALGEAIALGTARMSERGGALVVISDGQNTAGDIAPDDAARAARSQGVRVYAIAIGSERAAPLPVRLPSGRTVLREKSYPPDERTLREVAQLSGGQCFRATDQSALERVFGQIDALEPHPAAHTQRLPVGDASACIAWAAAALGIVLVLASAVCLRTSPALR